MEYDLDVAEKVVAGLFAVVFCVALAFCRVDCRELSLGYHQLFGLGVSVMNLFRLHASRIARWVLVTFVSMTCFMPLANAGMISTSAVVANSPTAIAGKARISNLLQRADVRKQMTLLGVDPAFAEQRVAALTDEQVASLDSKLAQMPAAGSDIVGAILVVFLLLLLTDILGLTSVYPFVKHRR